MFNLFNKLISKDIEYNNVYINDQELYEKLKTLSQQQAIDINNLVNNILVKHIESLKKKQNAYDDEKTFRLIDKYLFCTLNKEINIAITSDDVGHEKNFTLKDYKFSFPDRKLSFTLERKDDTYRFSIEYINNFDFSLRDDMLKVWVETKYKTWRFYLFFDKDELSKIGETFNSGKYEAEKEVREYEEYRYSNPIKFHLGHKKFYLGDTYKGEKEICSKTGRQVFLINSCIEEKNIFSHQSGTISFIAEQGEIGSIDYAIHYPPASINENEPYVEIVDIPGKQYINEGIRSEAIKYLEEISISKNIRKLTGMLSSVDLDDHKERLLHFYTKNGFTISGARIIKHLN